MKLYANRAILSMIMIFLIFSQHISVLASGKWCWTKSMANEPSWQFDVEKGGVNWGFCKEVQEQENRKKYIITVDTSTAKKSGTKSTIKIQLFGVLGVTAERDLIAGLDSGTSKTITLEEKDVGDVTKILVKISGQTGYRCSKIRVQTGTKGVDFDCLKRLEPCNPSGDPFVCQMELMPYGDTTYDVTIKTDESKDSGTDQPVLISLIGMKGISNPAMFSDTGLKAGSTHLKKLYLNNIGDITGYQLTLAGYGKWKPAFILVKQDSTQQIRSFDLSDAELVSPGKDTIRLDTSDNSSSSVQSSSTTVKTTGSILSVNKEGNINTSDGGFLKAFEAASLGLDDSDPDDDNDNMETGGGSMEMSGGEEGAEGESGSGGSASASKGTNSGFDMNDPWGGVMQPNEKKQLIELSCTQELLNPTPDANIFGPDYPTLNVNYIRVLAKCPANCHKIPGAVFGMGLHPDTSPICLSALVDNAMSDYGGIISISVFPGLEKYLIPPGHSKRGEISISNYVGLSKKSYTVARVDNPDLVEKDIRILDSEGRLAAEGRLEMRIEGVWSTICARQNNIESARRICKDLGYKDGKWAYPLDDLMSANGFCRTFKGRDHCGSDTYVSIFSDLDCTPNDQSFNTCNKKVADANNCGRSWDAIIQCTNENFVTDNPIPTGVVRLESVRTDVDSSIGRMEFYFKGSFKPVCEVGFNPNAAVIACKQMGFEGGEQYQQQEGDAFKKENSDRTPFAAGELNCSGKEKSVGDCKYKPEPDCMHNQDTVIKCVGKGDTSGRSQYNKPPIVTPPALGKLGMLKVFATCDTLGTDVRFRGDPGSVYLVKCPKDCNKVKGTIWGTGLYTLDSHLCLAAIHSGVISADKGGTFAYIKLWGNKFYKGMNRNEIASTEYNDKWTISFTVSKSNSSYKGMYSIFKSNMGGIYIEKSADVELKSTSALEYTQKKNIFQASSFLETNMRMGLAINPIFEWVELNYSNQFSDKAGGSVLIKNHSMTAMRHYTIIMRFTMTNFKNKKSVLFSYSGCRGFNIFIDENDNLNFGDPCSDVTSVNTNLMLTLNDRSVLYAVHSDNGLKVILFTEKNPKPQIKQVNKMLPIITADKVGIGRLGTNNDSHFFGKIDFIDVFDQEVPIQFIQQVIDKVNNKPKVSEITMKFKTLDERECVSPPIEGPTPGQMGAPDPPKDADPYSESDSDTNVTKYSELSGSFSSSSSSSSSFSSSSSTTISRSMSYQSERSKGRSASSVMSKSSSMSSAHSGGMSSAISSVAGGISSAVSSGMSMGRGGMSASYMQMRSKMSRSSQFSASYGSYDKSETNSMESMEIDCDVNLRDSRFTGSPGKIFRVKCPSCSLMKKPVYGTFIYHPLSSICKAANHAGTLHPSVQGYIIVELLPGRRIFNGSIGKDGNSSGTFASSTISFKTKEGSAPTMVSCEDSPNKAPFSDLPPGGKAVIICPPKCSKTNKTVYGTEVYADMSPICPAAIHWGAISDRGGEVEILIEGGQSYFKGTKGFGINSSAHESYIRAFKFMGIKSAVFYRYQEDFSGKLKDRWRLARNDETIHSHSDTWKFDEIRSDMTIVKEMQNVKTVHHIGAIRTKLQNEYASFIILKNAEWANGRIRTNFMFVDRGTVAILFRYMDSFNYYAVEFRLSEKQSNLHLVQKVDGSFKIVKTTKLFIVNDKWYRMSIMMHYDDIGIYIQSDKMREQKMIFREKMPELARGTLAFASNGNYNFYLSGVEVDDYVPNHSDKFNVANKRSWQKILKETNSRSRRKFCRTLFEKGTQDFYRCIIPHSYCKMRCDDHIPPEENILNYNCYKDCLKNIIQEELTQGGDGAVSGNSGSALNGGSHSKAPKVGIKVDFLPKNDNLFRPAKIRTVAKGVEDTYNISVEYYDNYGNLKEDKAVFPGDNIAKCGEKLPMRTDCVQNWR